MTYRSCSFNGCKKPHRAKGLCSGHYQQQAAGYSLTPLEGRGRRDGSRHRKSFPGTKEEYFWARVKEGESCWEWNGTRLDSGYGFMKVHAERILAHRFSYELHVGAIPEGMFLDHLCHNPPCVNPHHLRVADHTMNMQNRKGASSHSKSGIRGVFWDSSRDRWVGQVIANGKRHKKRFSSIDAAAEWVENLRALLHDT